MPAFAGMTILSLLPGLQASAWNAAGHQIVAQIAESQFTIREQKQLREKMGDWVPKAADPDLFAEKSKLMANWHFIDYPWVDEPVTNSLILVKNQNNIVWALKESKKALSVKLIPGLKDFDSVAVANLVHFVGDIHQPLHCISRVTEKHPKGDKGGNLFYVMHDGQKLKLHYFWDGGLGLLESLNPDAVRKLTSDISKEFPKNTLKLSGSFEDWSKESYDYAKDQVYKTTEGKSVSKDYITKGQQLAKQRLAQAGYRLADVLRELFL
ncbi:MAG: S1/P1 nuclease [Deltaproteobacteria bacterium]|nr:S1/P1 nuclease [Deltaproteobacteria bacterium]